MLSEKTVEVLKSDLSTIQTHLAQYEAKYSEGANDRFIKESIQHYRSEAQKIRNLMLGTQTDNNKAAAL
jgi:hypothetical protein